MTDPVVLRHIESIPSHISPERLQELCPGMIYIRNVLTEEEEAAIVKELDEVCVWDARLARRVQHFGYEFDYASRNALAGYPMKPFPKECQKLVERLASEEEEEPAVQRMNQLTVNEYMPGQGISNHIDTHSSLGDVIISISLLSNTVMKFTPISKELNFNVQKKTCIVLERRSMLILKGASRFAFKHGIPGRKNDVIDHESCPRLRRVSLTLRTIRDPPVCSCDYPDCCDSQELSLIPTRIAIRAPLGQSSS